MGDVSGIFALMQRDGGPVDVDAVSRCMERLRHRAIDGERTVELRWASLGHAHFWTTPEEKDEAQPLHDPTARLYLAFDGRLDNREEVGRALGLSSGEAASRSDAALVLAAFARWGADALPRFLGPFALVLLDETRRRVVLARDALGGCGLTFALDGRRLVVASEEAAVLAHPEVAGDLDERRLAMHLALAEPVDNATFFAAVRHVPPGHVVVVEPGAVSERCFRSVEAERISRRTSPDELAGRLRELLAAAVACRLRAPGRAAMLVSGGLDSGPIAALAAQSAVSHRLPSPLAISWVFDRFTACDERRYIESIAAMHGLESDQVVCDDALPLSRFESMPINPNLVGEAIYRWLNERCYRRAAERECRVVLSGVAGDDLYLGASDWLLSLIMKGRLGPAWREGRELRAKSGTRALVRGALIAPALPRWLVRLLRPTQPPGWLTEHARALLPVDPPWPVGQARAPREGQLVAVAGMWNASGVSQEAFHTHRCGIELRYPYRDLRLVEFMLGVPSFLLSTPSRSRPILRRALHGLLPEAVLERRDKGDFSPLYRKALASSVEGALVRDALSRQDALWRRFVRPEWVAQAPPGQRARESEEVVLWNCAWLELWRQRLLSLPR